MYNDIKESLRTQFNTFDDILQKMGQADIRDRKPEAMNQVTFKDFEGVVKGLPMGHKYST